MLWLPDLLSGALYEMGGRIVGILPVLVITGAAAVGATIVLPETLHRWRSADSYRRGPRHRRLAADQRLPTG